MGAVFPPTLGTRLRNLPTSASRRMPERPDERRRATPRFAEALIQFGARTRTSAWRYNRSLAMRRFLVSILVWTCLLAFGLGSTALRAGLVLCSDVHGGTRVEVGCVKVGAGECRSAAVIGEPTHEDDQCGPHPCEDTPLSIDGAGAQIAPRADVLPAIVPSLLVATVVRDTDQVRTRPRTSLRFSSAHPPDSIVRLRSVILLV